MANPRQFDLEDIVVRPGTYFNPQTEVLIVVDDSPDVDTEVFNMEDFEGADWVLIADRATATEWALAALLPRLVTTSAEHERLSHLLRTMPGEDGKPPPEVSTRLLAVLPPR